MDVERLAKALRVAQPSGAEQSEDEIPPITELRALEEAAEPLAAVRARQSLQGIAEDVIAGVLAGDPHLPRHLSALAESARQLAGPVADHGFALSAFLTALAAELVDAQHPADQDEAERVTRALIDAVERGAADWQPTYDEVCRSYAALLLRGEPRLFREAVGSFLIQRAELAITDLAPVTWPSRPDSGGRPATSALGTVLSLFDLANGAAQKTWSPAEGERQREPLLV